MVISRAEVGVLRRKVSHLQASLDAISFHLLDYVQILAWYFQFENKLCIICGFYLCQKLTHFFRNAGWVSFIYCEHILQSTVLPKLTGVEERKSKEKKVLGTGWNLRCTSQRIKKICHIFSWNANIFSWNVQFANYSAWLRLGICGII